MLILFDRTSAYDAFTELRVSFISYVATTGYTGIQLFGCVYFNIATTGYATFRFPKDTFESTDIPAAGYAQIPSFGLSFEEDGTAASHAAIQVVYFQFGCVDVS